jgi:hypothetical protein
MNMHDNDMDALFRSKLDNFEQEPSARVWDNISTELHGAADRRKRLIPLLRIAASVAILIAAGLFFLPRNKKADGVKPDKNKLARITPVKIPVKPLQTTVGRPVNKAVKVQQVVNTPSQQQQIAAVHKVNSQPVPALASTSVNKQTATDPDKTDAIANSQQATVLAAVPNKDIITKPVVPDVETSLKGTNLTQEAGTKPVLAATNIPADDDTKPSPVKKHKARGFGSILNAMIGVVDKRQDKIIEFTDTDEGDTITGINLGIVKIKKQK